MTELAVKANIRLVLQNFHKFDEKKQNEIYTAVFNAIYLKNAELSDTLYVRVMNEQEGKSFLNLLTLPNAPLPSVRVAYQGSPLQATTKKAIHESSGKPKHSEPETTKTPSITRLRGSEYHTYGTVLVPSDSSEKIYAVGLTKSGCALTCNCMDFVVRGNSYCKHMASVDRKKHL